MQWLFYLGLSCIKEHLPEHKTPLQPTNPSSGSDQADFFSNMKHVHTQETTKQLDAYLPVHQVAYRDLNIPGKTLRYVKVLPGCMHPVAQAKHCQLFFWVTPHHKQLVHYYFFIHNPLEDNCTRRTLTSRHDKYMQHFCRPPVVWGLQFEKDWSRLICAERSLYSKCLR